MDDRKRLTIRAKMIEGESLSSYLFRTANLNGINSIYQIWQLVKKQEIYKVDRSFSYKFDLFPSDIVYLNDLSNLLNIQANKLTLHSFEPIVSLLYPGAAGKMIFGKEIELKHRRFCRSCLKENGAFQLLWQVKEMQICHKHLTRIESKCHRCGCEQPYVKKDLLEHLKCNCCGELLFEKLEEPLHNLDMINTQLRIHRDWTSLFTIANYINSNYAKMPQPIHRKIAVLLLFLTTPQTERISYKKHPFFSPSQAQRLLKIVRNKSNDTILLGFILNTLRELNIEISNLMSLKVPMNFMRVLLNKTKDKKVLVVECKSEWCEFFDTVHKMVDMKFSKDKYVPKTHIYSAICICTSCWIQLGFNRKLSKWEDIYSSKNILWEINGLIEMGLSVIKIRERLGINYYKAYYYMGYLYRYNPFSNKCIKKLREINNTTLLIENFISLKQFWRNDKKLAIEATKLFGWNILSTFYYYWHPKVQEYINLKENSRIIDIKNQVKLKNDMYEVIHQLENNNIEISIKEVAASLGIVEETLRYHNLDKNINETKLVNKLRKKAKEEEFIFEKIDTFIKRKKNSEEQIFVYEVYKFIALSPKYLKTNYPDISKFISDSAKISKSEQKEIKKRNLERTIINIYKQYGRVDYSLLSESLGVTEKTLNSSQGIYKGIGSLIKQILIDLEEVNIKNRTIN